ncbi:TetR/AcrR family transcriptional regulator [Aurantiacibacter sp. MUD61]|uniref:TetR/AcrR family transcriptional regulator n=1 Tax=Aurantiacibacter sp. MUD61 TaxID=3009083 RepID=UPI0022F035B8|nr:TetR/AcrR family transcriptional regulator [Aurantiacibacter sp. MUD61]
MGSPAGVRLSSASRDEKRGLILSEAVRLFNQQGYFDTRLEDVAQRLDTAKTSISYHFKSKEVLLAEAYGANLVFAEQIIATAAKENSGLDKVTKWLRLYAEAASEIALGSRAPFATISDLAGLSDADRMAITSRMEAVANELGTFVEQGVEDGSIAVTSVEATLFFLLNSAHWLATWLGQIPPSTHGEAVDALVDLILYGVLSNPDMPHQSYLGSSAMENPDFLFDREARNKVKVDAFLRAGTRHLNRKGYTSVSLSDVAADLGVSRGSFYYYIDDKDTLLRGCVDRSLSQIEKAFEQYGKRGPAGEALFQIAATIYQGHVTDLDPLLRLPMLHALSTTERRAANARLARIRANFDELVATGMADGSVRQLEAEAIGEIILGAIHAATPQRLESFGIRKATPGPHSATATAFFEPLFTGIAARE